MKSSPLVDSVRVRLKEMIHGRRISHRVICEKLTASTGNQWNLSRFGKILNGHIRIRLEDVVLIANAADISLVELFREPGRELVADLRPTELRILHAVRDYPKIEKLVTDVIETVAQPKRRPSRAILRERMRLARRDD